MPDKNLPSYNDGDIVIRQSTISQFQFCPARVGYETHKGFLAPVNEAMCFGSCLHHLAAQDLLSGEPRLDLVTNMREWVEELLTIEYDWSIDKIDQPQQFFSELGVAYRTWREKVHPKLKDVVDVEQEQFLYLGDGLNKRIFLKGTPDVVSESRVIDFKTSRDGWARGKADLSLQASLYLPLVKQNYGLNIRWFTFFVYDRAHSSWDEIRTSRRVKDIDSALNTAYQYGRMLEAQVFPATPVPESSFQKKRGWYCAPTRCGAWNVCAFKYLNDDVDETAVAVRSWT